MTSVYIAGGWMDQHQLIKPMMARLRKEGIEISHDWTMAEGSKDVGGDHLLSKEERIKFAEDDLLGVSKADIIWLMNPTYKGARGSFIEFGYALAIRDETGYFYRIIVSGEGWNKSIFTELADEKFDSHEDALNQVITWHAVRT